MSSTETTNGSITGKLVDIHGNPETAAELRLYDIWHIPSDLKSLKKTAIVSGAKDTAVLTNSEGEYTFNWPGIGTYNIVGRSEDGKTVLISSIDIQDTSGDFREYKIGTDTVRVPGGLRGSLYIKEINGNGQSHAAAYLRGTDFFTVSDTNGLFSVTDVPQGTYTLIIHSFVAGYLQKEIEVGIKSGEISNLDTVFIDKDTNLIVNTAPVVSGLRDTVISINDTINFHVTATDSDGIINRYYWNFRDAGVSLFDTTDNERCDHAFPSSPVICTVTVSVSDSFGLTGSQSVTVKVLLDPPIADAGHDTTVMAGTLYTLHGSGTDSLGRIVKYRFDTNEDGLYEDSSSVSGVKQFKAAEIPGTYVIIIQVEDDDANTANSMMLLDVVSKEL